MQTRTMQTSPTADNETLGMPTSVDARASILAKQALDLVSRGQLEAGSRALREAASLSPENVDVKVAFLDIQQDQDIPVFKKLCKKFALEKDENAGKEALRFLERPDMEISDDVGDKCAELLLNNFSSLEANTSREITSRLLRQSLGARKYVAARVSTEADTMFGLMWKHGGGVVEALVAVLLDASAWKAEASREQAEKQIFEMFEDKLTGVDKPDQALAVKAVARLLAVDSARLHVLIEGPAFETLLSLLDIRQLDEVRSQATLATAKYLEAAGEKGQKALSQFVLSRFSRGSTEDLIVAFSVASALFPISPSVAASMFLYEGFVQSLVPLLEKKSKEVEIQHAALEMLSAACIDAGCREAIGKACCDWLADVVELSNEQNAGLAAVILAKVRGAEAMGMPKGDKDQRKSGNTDELVEMFRGMVVRGDDASKQRAIEGLAYASLQPAVKEDLIKDREFLLALFDVVNRDSGRSTLIFGGLTIISNLTTYLPNVSDEQKRLGQLKAYANAKKPQLEPDTFNKDEHVTARCKLLLDAGIIPVLVGCSKRVSPTSLVPILSILLSLSKHQKHRGRIAQQGGVKLLLQAHASITGTTSEDIRARRSAAHALARVLVSTNPAHVFGSALPISSAIRPLLSILEDDETSEQRDLLPVFESLLALTNIASTDDATRDLIIRLGWPRIEDLLLANNVLVQRAAVELVCNLMASPGGVAKFADGTKQAGNRLHILLALADVDDHDTRRAAGGALAMLTEWDAAVQAVLDRDRGITILLEMCREDDDELRHRGVACVRNLVKSSGTIGKEAIQRVKDEGGVNLLKSVLRETRNPEVLQIGIEALKALL